MGDFDEELRRCGSEKGQVDPCCGLGLPNDFHNAN